MKSLHLKLQFSKSLASIVFYIKPVDLTTVDISVIDVVSVSTFLCPLPSLAHRGSQASAFWCGAAALQSSP